MTVRGEKYASFFDVSVPACARPGSRYSNERFSGIAVSERTFFDMRVVQLV